MDDRLRALQRATRASPDDRHAGWSFVRALEQASDPDGAWRERCRLARSGDDEAWRDLERPPVGPRRMTVTAQRLLDGPICHVGGANGLLVIAGPAGVETLDSSTLETVWRAGADGLNAVVSGPWVAHQANARCDVVVRRVTSGDEVARVVVRDSVDLQTTADRLVAFSAGGTAVVCDLGGDPGAVLWRGSSPFGNVVRDAIIESHDTRGRARSISLRRLGEETTRWSAEGSLQHVDARIVLVSPSHSGASDSLSGREAATGNLLWTHALSGQPRLALAPDHVLLASPSGAEALDRTTGVARWTSPGDVAAATAGADTVAVAIRSRPAARKHRLTVRVLEASDGAVRGEAVALERRSDDVLLAPVPGGVVVFARLARRQHLLVRVGEP